MKQALSIKGISRYQEILTSLGSTIKTDIPFSDLEIVARKYRSAFSTIESDQAKGEGFMQDEISYQRLSPEELARVQQLLKTELTTGT